MHENEIEGAACTELVYSWFTVLCSSFLAAFHWDHTDPVQSARGLLALRGKKIDIVPHTGIAVFGKE